MRIFNFYRPKSSSVCTLVFIKRHLITFRKFRKLYTEFWFPSPSPPPYKHICQIGDPVLRYKAEKLNAEDIKKNEIQGVRKRISTLTVSFGCSNSNIGETRIPKLLIVILCQKYKSKMLYSLCPALISLDV